MRAFGRTVAAAAVAFVLVSLAEGQQRPPIGGFGGFGPRDITSLLQSPEVRKELNLTEQQAEKIPGAIMKALSDVLDEKQLKRLRQIDLQVKGNQAFFDPRVQKDLKLSEDQISNIKSILEDSRKEQAEIFKDAKGGNFQAIGEKMTALRKETNEKVHGVLTADQRKAWKQMLGEEFKFERPGGVGGFFKKGGDPKKAADPKKRKKDDV